MRFADLHLHTHHSDGVRTPAEIIREAERHHLEIVAISDHDNLIAFREAEQEAADRSILLIPAVELSADYRGVDVHLLGYAFDPDDEAIHADLERFREDRKDRGLKIVQRLIELGYRITEGRVRELCGGGAMGRPHVARALVEAGEVASVDEAFDRLLSPGRPGFIPKERLSATRAIAIIHEAGGLVSVAHPTLYPNHRLIVEEILDLGADGIEIFHPDVDPDSMTFYDALARHRGAIVTGGSDDHGFENRQSIGTVRVPEDRIRPILDLIERRA